MAGDWIKMRADLQTHPKVVRIMSALKADRFRVIGGLHAVWCLFDAHSVDGVLEGYTAEALDSLVGFPGISAALSAVGWLEVGDDLLRLPRFCEHNGKSAKRRATESERKRDARKSADGPHDVREVSASDADKMRAREEKRREEIKDNSSLRSESSSATEAQPQDVPGQRSIASLETAKQVRERRLAEITQEAVEAYNAAPFTKAHGGACPNVTLANEVRRKEVNRCLRVASQICQRMYGSPTVGREFWTDYLATVNEDEHASGRIGGGKHHPNWVPDFEYLTRPDVMTKLFDRAMSQEAGHG